MLRGANLSIAGQGRGGRSPNGRSQRPKEPTAGMGFLEKAQKGHSCPPARGLRERCKLLQWGQGGALATKKVFLPSKGTRRPLLEVFRGKVRGHDRLAPSLISL